ncbi:MAG: M14 family zinc carboxypeptidase, partial [Candidatus Heimdallarchaeaceae archaeon]
MVNRKIGANIVVTLFLFLLIPSLTLNTKANLTLETPTYSDITDTWTNTPLIYDLQYHNTSALWEEIDAFEAIAPDIIDVEVIGDSFFGKEIKAVRITNELRTHQKAKTLVVSHHHGREQIAVEVALRFILHLITGYGVDPLLTEAIDTQEIYVIPTINPDALDIVVNEGNHMLRKNARPFDDDGDGSYDEDPYDDLNGDGIISWYIVYEKSGPDLIYPFHYYEGDDNDADGLVNEDVVGHIDPNRNYPKFFRDGFGWSDDTQAGNYPGVTPFSEPETQTYRDFVLQHRFTMAYSLHSGTNATYFAKNENEYLEPDIAYAMINDFINMRPVDYHFNDAFADPPVADPGYAAGIWDNWMYYERETLMPVSLELYGNKSANFELYVTEIPIIDNATHMETEWKGINYFYSPVESVLNAHWDDVGPFFDYLLENTPVLEVEATLSSVDDLPGSLVNISFFCKNLSPKLHTVSTVDLHNYDGARLFDGDVILADSNILINALFELPLDFTDTYEIKVGNDYTGYYHFILKSDVTTGIN